MSKNVLVAVADGIEEFEAITIIDILRRAGIEVTVASVGDIAITASRGTKLVADAPIAVCTNNNYDMIVLPGGMPGANNLRDSVALSQMLKRQVCEGRYYAAICASPSVVLAYHGLTAGKKAVCYPGLEEPLGDGYCPDKDVAVDGKCITSKGPGHAMAFSLKLVEVLLGKEVSAKVADDMLIG